GRAWPAALVVSLGNTFEPVAAALLLGRLRGFDPALRRVRDGLALAGAGAAAGAGLAAAAALTLWRLEGDPWRRAAGIAAAWWTGDALGVLVVAPLLLVWLARAPPRRRGGGPARRPRRPGPDAVAGARELRVRRLSPRRLGGAALRAPRRNAGERARGGASHLDHGRGRRPVFHPDAAREPVRDADLSRAAGARRSGTRHGRGGARAHAAGPGTQRAAVPPGVRARRAGHRDLPPGRADRARQSRARAHAGIRRGRTCGGGRDRRRARRPASRPGPRAARPRGRRDRHPGHAAIPAQGRLGDVGGGHGDAGAQPAGGTGVRDRARRRRHRAPGARRAAAPGAEDG